MTTDTKSTPEQVAQLLDDARKLQGWERSVLPMGEGSYRAAGPGEESEEEMECPLCDGGWVDGQRYDAKATLAATLVGYGIGDGLAVAERWAAGSVDVVLHLATENARLRAENERRTLRVDGAVLCQTDVDVVIADLKRLRAELEQAKKEDWGCRACGSSGDFIDVTHPEGDHDVECVACGRHETGPLHECLDAVVSERNDAKKELSALRTAHDAMRERLRNALRFFHREVHEDMTHDNFDTCPYCLKEIGGGK